MCSGEHMPWGPCAVGTVCRGDRVLWGPCAVGTMWLSFQFHPGKTMVWIMGKKKQLVQCHEMNGGGWGPCKSGHQLSTLVPKHSRCLSLLAIAWLPSPPAVAWLPAPAVGRLSLRELGPAQSYQRFFVKHVKEKGRGSTALVQLAGNRGPSSLLGEGKGKQYSIFSPEQSPGSPRMVPEVHAGPWDKSTDTPRSSYHRLTGQGLVWETTKTPGLGVPSGSSGCSHSGESL